MTHNEDDDSANPFDAATIQEIKRYDLGDQQQGYRYMVDHRLSNGLPYVSFENEHKQRITQLTPESISQVVGRTVRPGAWTVSDSRNLSASTTSPEAAGVIIECKRTHVGWESGKENIHDRTSTVVVSEDPNQNGYSIDYRVKTLNTAKVLKPTLIINVNEANNQATTSTVSIGRTTGILILEFDDDGNLQKIAVSKDRLKTEVSASQLSQYPAIEREATNLLGRNLNLNGLRLDKERTILNLADGNDSLDTKQDVINAVVFEEAKSSQGRRTSVSTIVDGRNQATTQTQPQPSGLTINASNLSISESINATDRNSGLPVTLTVSEIESRQPETLPIVYIGANNIVLGKIKYTWDTNLRVYRLNKD